MNQRDVVVGTLVLCIGQSGLWVEAIRHNLRPQPTFGCRENPHVELVEPSTGNATAAAMGQRSLTSNLTLEPSGLEMTASIDRVTPEPLRTVDQQNQIFEWSAGQQFPGDAA